MTIPDLDLPLLWFAIIGLILLLYVVLDGFDLGAGILSLFAKRDERHSSTAARSLGSVWEANETWLIILGGALFGAFPPAYGIVLHALYIPITAMLAGLILRGVAFGFLDHAANKRPWNLAFASGSLLAAAAQGLALGGLVQGMAVRGQRFVGTVWDWFSPFSVLVAVGVVAGYSLLGATYLIMKTEGEPQRKSAHHARVAALCMLAVAVGVTLWTPFLHGYIAARWLSPYVAWLAPLPLSAAYCFGMLWRALRLPHERSPFFWSLGIFVTSFAGLAASLHPYLIPQSLTVMEAASSRDTLIFMLIGIGTLLPVIWVYNGYQYAVFGGKVRGRGYSDSA
jgi:cytochrome d ubiquinol oxidase subunit II